MSKDKEIFDKAKKFARKLITKNPNGIKKKAYWAKITAKYGQIPSRLKGPLIGAFVQSEGDMYIPKKQPSGQKKPTIATMTIRLSPDVQISFTTSTGEKLTGSLGKAQKLKLNLTNKE